MSVSSYQRHQEAVSEWTRTRLDGLETVERELWLLVVAALVADVWLTQVGLRQGLHEGNPVVRSLVETYGFAALPALKTGVLAIGGVTRELVPRAQAPVVPLGLALPWVVAALVNGTLLVVA